jgi:aromatic-amino-acid transaminase
MFQDVPRYPGDPILSLNEDFQRDSRSQKVNLSIGYYFNEIGTVPMMRAVVTAEQKLLNSLEPRPYLPMAGHTAYRDAAQALVFGSAHPARLEKRIATLQSVGGNGALKIGADFLKRYFPTSSIWVSDPTWDNHRVVFETAGLTLHRYPYYDPETGGLAFGAMTSALSELPPKSVVLLHACCHNPTGVDLTADQWRELAVILRRIQAIAFVDMAYQGFGNGLDEDASSIRLLANEGIPTIVANSFSKNFSLYGERVGAISIVCESEEESERVLGQLMLTARSNYSIAPTHGARLVADVLGNPLLSDEWATELEEMRSRILRMRKKVHSELGTHLPKRAVDRYIEQTGMFTYTGLKPAQVDRLRDEHGVYLLRSGRMCVAGLNDSNVGYVASSIKQVLTAEA